ncbi:PP2C family protein-serine/threonine phosphatase [Nocardia sp. NPDC127579]|uniref:PP2C family protein-serine/threonine phosphatase n=1 Tax=Nocardia sp. NPDC127579 TaxID=3345402 RepID=UPI003641EEBF
MRELVIDAAAGSAVGNRYRANFDVVHLARDPLCAVVADGMGDSEGSARAGRTAVDTFVEWTAAVRRDGPAHERADLSTVEVLRGAVAAAQQRVGAIGRELGGLAGCTLTALTESPEGFWITQIGDSRVYRLREGLLELLTVDHTMAWLGVTHGWYPFHSHEAAAARYHLTRYIGHTSQPEADIVPVTVRPGDRYLLCSDGIADQVSYQELQHTLSHSAAPAAMVDRLLAAADAAGGNDNASAIVVSAGRG